MSSVNCGICGNTGWIWDAEAIRLSGRNPHQHCHCVYGDRLAVEDAAEKHQEQENFKTCPTCKGAGKVKRGR